CGVFSSGMSFAIDAAKPMEAVALHLGVNPLYAALPSYVIIMGGGAVVNMSYCFIRLAVVKSISLGRGQHPPASQLRQLDAAHERLRAVRRNCRAGARRVGRRGFAARTAAVGRH